MHSCWCWQTLRRRRWSKTKGNGLQEVIIWFQEKEVDMDRRSKSKLSWSTCERTKLNAIFNGVDFEVDLSDWHWSVPWIWRETSTDSNKNTRDRTASVFLLFAIVDLVCHQKPLLKLRVNMNAHFFPPVSRSTLFLINTSHFFTRMPG